MNISTRLIAALWFSASLCAFNAQAASDIALSTTSPSYIALAPLMDTSIVLRIRNNGPDAAPLVSVGTYTLNPYGYSVSMPQQAGCSDLLAGSILDFPLDSGYHFMVGPLAVGQQQECRLLIQRPAASGNFAFQWLVNPADDPLTANNDVRFGFGALTDVGLSQQPLSFRIDQAGIAEGAVQLRVTNFGPNPVAPMTLGDCPTFGQAAGFTIDGDFPGGCGDGTQAPFCFGFGYGYAIPSLVAGETYACSLRLRSLVPFTQTPMGATLWIEEVAGIEGADVFDRDPLNNQINLMLGPLPATAIPSMSMVGLTTLLIALFGVAGYRQMMVRQPVAAGDGPRRKRCAAQCAPHRGS